MIQEEYIRIDYAKVFSILPEIMSIPMTLIRGKWYASRYIDGSFSTRRDKLVCRLVKDGIQILEQGGVSMTLFNWMLQYGNCRSRMDVRLKLLTLSSAVLVIPNYLEKEAPQIFVPKEYMDRSEYNRLHAKDNFTLFLYKNFGTLLADTSLRKYHVGHSWGKVLKTGTYKDLTQFWYVNKNNEICHDKKILYKEDGHRDHDYGGGRSFTKGKGYSWRCLFGEHLLANRRGEERVYVVESEKTAIICDIYFRRGIWLAVGGLKNTKGLDIKPDYTVLADVDGWEEWNKKYPGQCPKWWMAYQDWECGGHDDIADYVLWKIKNK